MRMRELAREGLAILVISSDLPKVLTISDRILMMRAGLLAGEIGFDEVSEERIMALAALEHTDPDHPEVRPTGICRRPLAFDALSSNRAGFRQPSTYENWPPGTVTGRNSCRRLDCLALRQP
jgi:ABC-type multidrug transport system ATPase subunit